jgi:3-deoxy-7-phosphoheptulonate synthase
VDEWLKAADYVLKGHDQVVLCERGIRTFETSTRNTLDLNSVAYLKAHAQLPVIVDPSHGTGRPELITPLAAAAIAAGADGLIVEVHPRPREAKSDAFQAIDFAHFTALVDRCARVAEACDRRLAR